MTESSSLEPASAEDPTRRRDSARQLWGLWRQGQRPDVDAFLTQAGALFPPQLAAVLRVDQRERWQTGERIVAEAYLQRYPALGADSENALDLVYGEFLLREELGEEPTLREYVQRFPPYADALALQIELHQAMASGAAIDPAATRNPLGAATGLAARDGTPVPQAAQTEPTVKGYEILGKLGRGGMGVVYKALQRDANRVVALKMILAGADAGPEVLARFRTEIEAVARLHHPHIVPIYEVGEWRAGDASPPMPYFSMEFADGGSLAQKLVGVPLPFRRAAQLLEMLAQAIHSAHERGVIHRDLTPANVLLMADGTPKITDFGLAKFVERAAQSAARDGQQGAPRSALCARTQSGAILGTPSYMPPEQAAGNIKEAGPAGDVYGLGAIFYEMLTGRPPFRAETPLETLRQVLSEEPVSPSRLQPGLPRDLVTVCLKCLEKEPHKRYASALALAEDLGHFLEGKSIQARRAGLPERGWRWCRRNPALASATGLAVAALVAVTAISITFAVAQFRSKAAIQEALHSSQRLAAELALDTGQLLGEQGEANQALLWIARSLKLTPADAGELQSVARSNLGYWRTRINPLRAILRHDAEVWDMAFTPDGKTLLTGHPNGTVQLWDATSGESIGKRIGQPVPRSADKTFAVAFSPDGKSCLIGGADSTAQLWDLAAGTETWNRELGGRIRTAAFSADGRLLIGIVGAQGEWAQLWSVATGKPLSSPLEHKDLVLAVAFSRDGKTFVTESGMPDRGPGVARFWGADSKETRKPLEQPSAALGVAFSPDGKKLLTGHFDGKARLWDLSTDQLLLPPLVHGSLVRDVAFSPDGSSLLTGSYDGTARLWATATGALLGTPLRHGGMVKRVAFSPDGTTFVIGATDGTVRIWEVAASLSAAPKLPPEEPFFPLAFSSDCQTLMTRDMHHSVRLREAVSGKQIGEPLRHEHLVKAGAFSPDHNTAVTVEEKTTAGPWDITTTRLWNVATGKPIEPPLEHQAVNAVALSPDGKTAVTASGDARLWDAATGEKRKIRAFANDIRVFAVAFSPDGKTILTGGGSENTARLWDATTGQQIGESLQHTNFVLAIAFSPGGKTILTGCTDNTARLWDTVTGKQIAPPMAHRGAVNAVAFSLDGRIVLTGSRDKTARFWDAATGKLLGPPLLHPGPVQHVAFWHDGKTVLTAGEDKIARFWQLPTPVAGDADQLELWSQIITGMELEANGGVRVLDAATWQERRAQLNDSGFHSP